VSPRAFRWFVWDGRYAGKAMRAPSLFSDRCESGPPPALDRSPLAVELGASHELGLDDRIGVRIESVQTFSVTRMRPRFARSRADYIAVKLALKRIEAIGGLLMVVYRQPHPGRANEPDDELVVYRQAFTASELLAAPPSDVGTFCDHEGRRRLGGALVDDREVRFAGGLGSVYRFGAWVARRPSALRIDPRTLMPPLESLDHPMCVSDRPPGIRCAASPPNELGRSLGFLETVSVLWRTRWSEP
jgi:hypothetical protein